LIAAGTSFATAALALGAAVVAVELDAGVGLVVELLLLLPQAATAAAQSSETGTASQILQVRMQFLLARNKIQKSWRQHKSPTKTEANG
jgi:hypothetical protein